MNPKERKRPRAVRFVTPVGAVALGLAGMIAACKSGGTSQPAPGADAPKPAVKFAPERTKRMRTHLSLWNDNQPPPCPDVTAGQVYRMIEGIDSCPQIMSPADMEREFHDPWGQNVLKQTTNRPANFDDIINAATTQNSTLSRHAVLLGEGGQMAKAPNHDLRFIVTWGDKDFKNAQLFFSARPPSGSGDQPKVLEVIGFDSQKQKLNFFHYEGAWIWTGDSSHAQDPKAGGQGCFACHLDGGLNMKELTVPWNNWNSVKAKIDPGLLDSTDPLVTQHLLKDELQDAYDFEPIIRATNTTITSNWVQNSAQGGTITKAALKPVLARLFGTSTINLASSPTLASSQDAIGSLPNDFFLFDTALRDPDGIGLSYGDGKLDTTSPGNLNISIARSDYSAFLSKYQVQMVDRGDNNAITYQQPGGTFFPFFVPTPPYEDALAIRAMIQQKIISPKFAAAVLMVDLQNPIFSEVRKSLFTYFDQMGGDTYQLDQLHVPTQFMGPVLATAVRQPQCNTDGANLYKCTAEQQLVYWWSRFDLTWKTDFQGRIQTYLDTVKANAGKPEGAEQYLKLMIARGDQFAHNPVVCNLDEFPLLLPTTNLDQGLRQQSWQMQIDGTIAPKKAYTDCTN